MNMPMNTQHTQVRRLAVAMVGLLALTAVAAAQKPLDRSKPLTDPANDPYTRGGKEKYVEAAGYASMGGFEFGARDDTTTEVSALLEGVEVRWIETAHFELGIALPKVKVTKEERKKVKAELAKLQKALPVVKPDTKFLDPWLRAHLYAQRLEEHYARLQEIMGRHGRDVRSEQGELRHQYALLRHRPLPGSDGKVRGLAAAL